MTRPRPLTPFGPGFVLVAALGAGGCDRPSPPSPRRPPAPSSAPGAPACALRGAVLDRSGAPVAGARVAAVPLGREPSDYWTWKPRAAAATGAAGEFALCDLAPGAYGLSVSDRRGAARASVAIAPGGREQRLTLGEAGAVSIALADERGAPLAGVEARAYGLGGAGGESVEAVYVAPATGPDGRAELALPPGQYALVAEAPGRVDGFRYVRTPDPAPQRLVLPAAATAGDLDALARWARAAALPIAAAEPGPGLDDLKPLRPLFAGARVVSLGEATHGTREFFQLKHRFFQHLVQEHGFTAIAFEADYHLALAVNDYVLTGRGDPASALHGLVMWPWRTEEVLALVRWMRAYNADPKHARKVKFLGFDAQLPAGAAEALVDFLRRADPAHAGEAARALAPVRALRPGAPAPPEAVAGAGPFLDALGARIAARRDEYERAVGAEQARRGRWHARQLAQWLAVAREAPPTHEVRDRVMAENVLELLRDEGPEAKIALWAHNGHVDEALHSSPVQMGGHLRRELGDSLATVGFTFGRGGFRAWHPVDKVLRDVRAGAPPAANVEAALARAGRPLFALDLRGAPADVAPSLRKAVVTREFGAAAVEGDDQTRERSLSDSYDVFVYVDETRPSVGLPGVALPGVGAK